MQKVQNGLGEKITKMTIFCYIQTIGYPHANFKTDQNKYSPKY
jgi:hypothetical protein